MMYSRTIVDGRAFVFLPMEEVLSKHQSNIMVIRCGDDRYTIPGHDYAKAWEAIIAKENADVRFGPGGGFGSSLEFVLPKTRSAWEHRLELAPSLGIERLLLIDHLDCGAFAATYGSMTPEAEEVKHLEAIAQANQMARDAGLAFTAYLHDDADFRQI